MPAYGNEFSSIYRERWDLWSRMMWPFLMRRLDERGIAGGRWLDLCCGTGSLLRLASERGFQTVGVDRSRHQLAHARELTPESKLVCADILTARLSGQFDVVTCLFDSLNYILDEAFIAGLFRKIAVHLTSHGLFVFDVKTPEGFRAESDRTFVEDHRVVCFQSHYDEDTLVHRFQVVGFVQSGKHYRRFEEEHVQRSYERRSMDLHLCDAGFACECLDGERFTSAAESSRRILYLCHRREG
ncbi:MAG: hypothetical protein AMXMBFR84_42640 [Candidatus Hydrogenedentota bacterium]